ncbi:MAG: hypothetical protein WC563_15685 [Brevundimonas sp.]
MSTDRIVSVRGSDGRTYQLNMTQGNVVLDNGVKLEARELSSADVHLQSAMQSFATGYGTNAEQCIADIVCPPLLVDKPTDKYHTWSSNDLLNDVTDDAVGDSGSIQTVSPSKSNDSYTVEGHALASFVSNRVVAAADASINPEAAAIRRIMNAMNIRREVRVAAVLDDAAAGFLSYKTTLVAATSKWNGGTTADPVKDLMDAQEGALKPITHFAMAQRTWNNFVRNVNVSKYGLANAGDKLLSMSPDEVAQRVGIVGAKFVIGALKRKSPTAGTVGYVWGNDVCCLHIPAGAETDEEEVPTARNFRWNTNGAGGFEVRQWDVPQTGGRGGRMIAVVVDEVVKLVAAPTGWLIVGAYA